MVGFRGGEKAEAYFDKIRKGVQNGPHVRVGFLENATTQDGTQIAMIAAIQEFGAPSRNIPPRPFFRTMIARHRSEWGGQTARLYNSNDGDVPLTLGQMGQHIEGQLRQSIVDMNAPPLSPITLMLRKMRWQNPALVVGGATVGEAARRVARGESTSGVSTKPLVDTGDMLASISSEVVTT